MGSTALPTGAVDSRAGAQGPTGTSLSLGPPECAQTALSRLPGARHTRWRGCPGPGQPRARPAGAATVRDTLQGQLCHRWARGRRCPLHRQPGARGAAASQEPGRASSMGTITVTSSWGHAQASRGHVRWGTSAAPGESRLPLPGTGEWPAPDQPVQGCAGGCRAPMGRGGAGLGATLAQAHRAPLPQPGRYQVPRAHDQQDGLGLRAASAGLGSWPGSDRGGTGSSSSEATAARA